MSRSVLFLDSWTKGIRMFLPISDYLRARRMRALLVHWGSWDAEPGRPKEEHIRGLLCRDISYYGTRMLYKVLKRENPDCIVTLTTNNLIDRAKILAARALQIPSVFLMHGILATGASAVDAQVKVLRPTLRRKRFSKIPKHLRYIAPNYFYSGWRENSRYLLTSEPYRVMYNTFRFPEKWKMYPAPSQELQCDACLAWGDVYKEFIAETYGYDRQSIIVTGHPPLDKASRLLKNPPLPEEIERFKRENAIGLHARIVVYIEGAFANSRYRGWTQESLLEHLREVAGLCVAAKRHLVVKLHPNTLCASWLQEGLRDQATIVQGTDSEMLIWSAESVVGHSSTLINSAIALHRPVLIPRWGISRVIPSNFDTVAPVVACEKPEDLLRGIKEPEGLRVRLDSRRAAYLRDYLEPLDGRSEERICEIIADVALGRASDADLWETCATLA